MDGAISCQEISKDLLTASHGTEKGGIDPVQPADDQWRRRPGRRTTDGSARVGGRRTATPGSGTDGGARRAKFTYRKITFRNYIRDNVRMKHVVRVYPDCIHISVRRGHTGSVTLGLSGHLRPGIFDFVIESDHPPRIRVGRFRPRPTMIHGRVHSSQGEHSC